MYNSDIRQSLKVLREYERINELVTHPTTRRKKEDPVQSDNDDKSPLVGTIFKDDKGIEYKWEGRQWSQKSDDNKWIGGRIKNSDANVLYLDALEKGNVIKPNENLPKKDDSFEFGGYVLTFDGERWGGTTKEGSKVNIADDKQEITTQKWKESLEKLDAKDEEATGETLTSYMEKQGKTIGDATPQDFIDFIGREKGASDEQADAMLDAAGVNKDDSTIAGNEDELAKIVNQAEIAGDIEQAEPEEEAVGGAENIITDFERGSKSGSLRRARLAAREAKKTGGENIQSNLAKLGAAFLIANKLA